MHCFRFSRNSLLWASVNCSLWRMKRMTRRRIRLLIEVRRHKDRRVEVSSRFFPLNFQYMLPSSSVRGKQRLCSRSSEVRLVSRSRRSWTEMSSPTVSSFRRNFSTSIDEQPKSLMALSVQSVVARLRKWRLMTAKGKPVEDDSEM